MSWKNLVYAGMFCALLAVPAMAQPTIEVTNQGLDANGDWEWLVQVVPDENMFTDPPDDDPDRLIGGSVALEAGFIASDAALLGAAKNGANFPEDDPGAAIAGVSATGPGVTTDGETLTAFLGSEFFNDNDADPDTDEPRDAVTITTEGPSTNGSLTTTIDLVGAHGGGARVAQDAQNFDGHTGTFSRTAFPGDANLSNLVDDTDLATVLLNFNDPGHWGQGNFNGDSAVNDTDLATVLLNFNMGPGSGAGLGSGVAAPEPSSLVLIVLGGMLAALRFRR